MEVHLTIIKDVLVDNHKDEDGIINLPRRRNTSQRPMVTELAQIIYPELTEIAAVIKYEILRKKAKRLVRQTRQDKITVATQRNLERNYNRVTVQGPWAGQEL